MIYAKPSSTFQTPGPAGEIATAQHSKGQVQILFSTRSAAESPCHPEVLLDCDPAVNSAMEILPHTSRTAGV